MSQVKFILDAFARRMIGKSQAAGDKNEIMSKGLRNPGTHLGNFLPKRSWRPGKEGARWRWKLDCAWRREKDLRKVSRAHGSARHETRVYGVAASWKRSHGGLLQNVRHYYYTAAKGSPSKVSLHKEDTRLNNTPIVL